MHERVSTTLQEAKPMAGSSRAVVEFARANGGVETDRRRESKPRSPNQLRPGFTRPFWNAIIVDHNDRASAGHPDENQSGRAKRDRTGTRARTCRNAPPPDAGENLRRMLNPMSAAGRERKKGRPPRPARLRLLETRVLERQAHERSGE